MKKVEDGEEEEFGKVALIRSCDTWKVVIDDVVKVGLENQM